MSSHPWLRMSLDAQRWCSLTKAASKCPRVALTTFGHGVCKEKRNAHVMRSMMSAALGKAVCGGVSNGALKTPPNCSG